MYDEDAEINRLIDEAADEYVSFDEFLVQKGMTLNEALRAAEDYRIRFFGTLARYGMGNDSINDVCCKLIQLLKKDQSGSVIFLYTSLLIENGLLFGSITDEEQKIKLWFEQRERVEYLTKRIKLERILRKQFSKLISHVPKQGSADFDMAEQTLLYEISTEYSFLAKHIGSIYFENLGEMIRKVNNDMLYSQIKPYIYSTVISKRHKAMLAHKHYSPNIKAIFKSTKYRIDKDNGKNFNTYQAYLELYVHLRSCYADESDIALSDYCFANLSNLSEWYYVNCDPTEDVPMTLHQTLDIFAKELNMWSMINVNREILVNMAEYL